MIERYSRKEMTEIWTLESKFQYYLNVELAVCDAYAQIEDNSPSPYPSPQRGEGIHITKEIAQEIRQKACFNIERIDEIEREVKHDVIAFLTCVNESLGDLGRYVHVGMTSSDVIDTAFAHK